MKNLESKRTLNDNEVKKVHSWSLKWILGYLLFLIFYIFSFGEMLLLAYNKLQNQKGNWFLILISLVIFSSPIFILVIGIKDYAKYLIVGIDKKVYLINDKFHTKGNRYGVKCYIGDQEVIFLPQEKKKVKSLSYGSLIEAEAIKSKKEYLVIKVLKIIDNNKSDYRFNLKTGGNPMTGEIYKKK